MYRMPQYLRSANDKFKFGKYSGKTLLHVAENDPSYIKWCIGEFLVKLTNEAVESLEELGIELTFLKPRSKYSSVYYHIKQLAFAINSRNSSAVEAALENYYKSNIDPNSLPQDLKGQLLEAVNLAQDNGE
jgi:hypothetical protein